MSDVVRCGYTDTEWVVGVALPRVRATILATAAKRIAGKLNGRKTPSTRAAIEAALGRCAALVRWGEP